MRLRNFGALVLIPLIAAALLGVGIWYAASSFHPAQSTESTAAISTPVQAEIVTATSSNDIYTNSRYGYEVTMPTGWRIASQLMQTLQSLSRPSSSPAPPDEADTLLITKLSLSDESRLAAQLEQMVTSLGRFPIYSDYLSGDFILLQVSNLDAETLESLEQQSHMKLQGSDLPYVSQEKEVTLSSAIQGVRYVWRSVTQPYTPSIDVSLPYPKNATDQYGTKINSVLIRTIPNKDFSENVFSNFYNSFRYTR